MDVRGCSFRTRSYINQPQKLEIRQDEVANSITTVAKDSMVIIITEDMAENEGNYKKLHMVLETNHNME